MFLNRFNIWIYATILISVFFSSHSIASSLLDELITYYEFEGNLLDSSPSGNNASGTSLTFAAGLNGTAAVFGNGSQAIAGPAINSSTSFTVSSWVRPTSIRVPQPMIIVDERNVSGGGSCSSPLVPYPVSCADFQLTIYDGKFAFSTSTFSAGQSIATQTRIFGDDFVQANQDYSVIARYDSGAGEMSLWIDGQLEAQASVGSGLLIQPDTVLRIGRSTASADQGWIGMIDDVRIYNRALAPSEIAELYQFGFNDPPALNPIGTKISQEGHLLEFSITATDPNPGDLLTFSTNNLPPGATFNPETATFTWIPDYDQAGNYENVEFTVMDNGNHIELDTELITITIGNVNRAPVFEPVGPQTVNEGELVQFTIVTSDPDENNVILAATNIPDGAFFDMVTGVFSWIPDYLQGGTYTVTFTAVDYGEPVESSEMGVPITVGNRPNPIELTNTLIDEIRNSNLPHYIINSYLANLKKVNAFVGNGKIGPAVNQLFAFACKVEEDWAQRDIEEVLAHHYTFIAAQITEDLGVDAATRICN